MAAEKNPSKTMGTRILTAVSREHEIPSVGFAENTARHNNIIEQYRKNMCMYTVCNIVLGPFVQNRFESSMTVGCCSVRNEGT